MREVRSGGAAETTLLLGGAIAVAVAACSGTATSPTQPVSTISGVVSALQSGSTVSGVTVSAEAQHQSTVTTSTTASGAYSVDVPANTTSWTLKFTADGYLPRLVPWKPGSDGSNSLISTAAPFSLDFYRQFVRGSYQDSGLLRPLARWTQAPKIYVRTKTVDLQDPIPDAVIDAMQQMAGTEIPLLTGDQFNLAQFERGDSPPSVDTPGWIIVWSYSNAIPGHPEAGGLTDKIGANPDIIGLVLDPTPFQTSPCRYRMAGAFFHELVHALGYYHTQEGWSVNNDCGQFLPDVLYHAAIAYARPVGNTDPDTDPGADVNLTSAGIH